MLKTNYI